ncbi:MAG: hypothetical protein QM775_17615 [Pirellulales bacterium]
MTRRSHRRSTFAVLLGLALATAGNIEPLQADGEPAGPAKPEQVKRLAAASADEVCIVRLVRLSGRLRSRSSAAPSQPSWNELIAGDFDALDNVAAVAALTDDRVAELVRICSGPDRTLVRRVADVAQRSIVAALAATIDCGSTSAAGWPGDKMYDQAVGVLGGLNWPTSSTPPRCSSIRPRPIIIQFRQDARTVRLHRSIAQRRPQRPATASSRRRADARRPEEAGRRFADQYPARWMDAFAAASTKGTPSKAHAAQSKTASSPRSTR